jgi:hypothetical protein
MQLELAYWPRDCVRSVLNEYVRMRSRGVCSETLDRDYACRVDWLLEALGELTPADEVDFVALEAAARKYRGILKDVTMKKRFSFWRSAVMLAAKRKLVSKDAIPDLPPDLLNDAAKMEDHYTPAEFRQFALAVPPGRFRRLAHLSMLTGMHTIDLDETARRHFEPDFVWAGSELRGRWLRRCTKNVRRGVRACWCPMEPELREMAIEWLSQPGDPDHLIVGPLYNVDRTFEAAAARAGLPKIRKNLGFRASHAAMLLARGYNYEYVRIILGHVGEVSAETIEGHLVARAKRPTTLSRHYLRPSPGEHLPQG